MALTNKLTSSLLALPLFIWSLPASGQSCAFEVTQGLFFRTTYCLEPEADLRGADLRGLSLVQSYTLMENPEEDDITAIPHIDLTGADLRGARLDGAAFRGISLRGARLDNATMRAIQLENVDLSSASLNKADLRGSYLVNVDLRGASLQDADLGPDHGYAQGAYLYKVDFTGADLRGVDFTGTWLRDIQISRADLGRSRFALTRSPHPGDACQFQTIQYNLTTQFPTGFRPEDHHRSLCLKLENEPQIAEYRD